MSFASLNVVSFAMLGVMSFAALNVMSFAALSVMILLRESYTPSRAEAAFGFRCIRTSANHRFALAEHSALAR